MKHIIPIILLLILSTSSQAQTPNEKQLATRIEEQTREMASQNFAVIVGINEYENQNQDMHNLEYCESDAIEMYNTLVNVCHYPPSHVFLYLDGKGNEPSYAKKASQDALTRLFDSFANVDLYKNVDTIIFYFSGHGGEYTYNLKESGEKAKINLLIPVDGSNYANLITTRNLSLQKDIIDKLDSSRFKRQVLFIDACRISVGSKGESGTSGFGKNITFGTGMKVLFGTKPNCKSWEYPEIKHGLFTKYLLDGLKGDAPDTNKDGFISFGELETYVDDKMGDYSRRNPERQQTPYSGGDGQSSIPVVPDPNPDFPPQPTPTPKPTPPTPKPTPTPTPPTPKPEPSPSVKLPSDAPKDPVSAEYIKKAIQYGLLEPGNSNFGGNTQATRYDLAMILSNLIQNLGNSVDPPFSFSHGSANYPDVPTDHYAFNAIVILTPGFMLGYPDGCFRGDRTITRYELIMIMCRVYELLNDKLSQRNIDLSDKKAISRIPTHYIDVPTDHWASEAVDYASQNGIYFPPVSDKFKGSNLVTRYEILILGTMIYERVQESLKSSKKGK